jgi:hypothetical protein
LEWTSNGSAAENRSAGSGHQSFRQDLEVLMNQTRPSTSWPKRPAASWLRKHGHRLAPAARRRGPGPLLLDRVQDASHRDDAIARDLREDEESQYVVRSRHAYVEKTDVTRMQDRVIANLYRPDQKGTIPVYVELGKIDKVSRTRWSVPVRVTIPVDALSVGPDGKGSFSVFVATGGMIGVMSDVEQRTRAYASAEFAEREHITYELDVTFNGASSVISMRRAGFRLEGLRPQNGHLGLSPGRSSS